MGQGTLRGVGRGDENLKFKSIWAKITPLDIFFLFLSTGDETSSTRSKRSRRAILPEPEEPRQDLIQPPEAPMMMETLDLQPPQTDLPEHLHRTSPEKARADVSVGVRERIM